MAFEGERRTRGDDATRRGEKKIMELAPESATPQIKILICGRRRMEGSGLGSRGAASTTHKPELSVLQCVNTEV